MKKASKLTILSASMLLAACSSAQKPAQVIEPMLEETIVIPTNTPTVGSSVSQSGKKRASKQQANRQMNNNQRRVVQVTSVKRAEQGVLVDIQEGKVKGVHNVTSRYGENHIVNVSRNYPTIILTPFSDPEILGNEDVSKYGSEIIGSTAVINPKTSKNIWVTVYDLANPRGMPASLTLVPKTGLMSQTINLAIEKSPAEQVNGLQPASGSFAQTMTNILKDIVMLKVPAGYTVRPLREKFALENGMQTMPVERYSSTEFDVYRYRLNNTLNTRIEMNEEMFRINKRVRAASFYPKTTLYPGETTDVLILISKRGAR